MGLAPYFDRAAAAASQLLRAYDDQSFRERLHDIAIGISIGEDARDGEGSHAADLTVRLLSRLYPTIVFHASPAADETSHRLAEQALRINPNIEVRYSLESTHAIILGTAGPLPTSGGKRIYVGSDRWDARTSPGERCNFGTSTNPFGAGAAAALACADVFASVFGQTSPCELPLTLSTFDGTKQPTVDPIDLGNMDPVASCALIGLGAIGNAAVWALEKATIAGTVALVDAESIDLSNLQRYVLAEMSDVGRPKADHLASRLTGRLVGKPFPVKFDRFVSHNGYGWDQILVGVDSAKIRRQVQAALPRRVVNAWTQLEDFGVSEHGDFGSEAACLECLYLRSSTSKSQHEVVSESLKIPEFAIPVRDLLYNRQPVPAFLLDHIIAKFAAPPEVRQALEGLPMLDLYTKAMCGSVLLRFEDGHLRPQELHVPIAHQSALAGIMLAARALRQRARPSLRQTRVTRIDLRAMLPDFLTINQQAVAGSPCICRDRDFIAIHKQKYCGTAHG